MEKLKISIKKALVFAIAMILCFAGVYAATTIYWHRQVSINFNVIGIAADLLQLGYENYINKVVATNLDSNGQAVLTIFSENFHEIWINSTWTSNASGLIMNETAQHIRYYWGSGYSVVEPVGAAFNLNGFQTINKTATMWHDPGHSSGGPFGYGLLITMIPWTEYVTTPGAYTVTISLDMGFV